MDIKKLTDMALEDVCSNLLFNYNICKLYSLKIPRNIGDMVYNFYLNNNYSLNFEDLCFFHKDITSLSKLSLLNKHFSKNPKFNNFLQILDGKQLREIDFSNCNFYEEQCKNIGKFLTDCFQVEKIYFDCNKDMHDGWSDICLALDNSTNTLREIHFSRCDLQDSQCKVIGKLLSNCHKIELVDLSNNGNSIEYQNGDIKNGWYDICSGLMNASENIKVIDFSWCDLNASQCEEIGKLLLNCINLKEVNLSGNDNMGNGWSDICQGLSKSSNSLTELSLCGHILSEIECQYMSSLLVNFKNIEIVNLSYNNFMQNGWLDICTGLTTASNALREIRIDDCAIDEENCKDIGNLLQNCYKIEIIDLSRNCNMEDGLTDICKGLLSSSNTLQNIYLSDCNLNEKDCENIGNLLVRCNKIKVIDLSHNDNISQGFTYVCDGLMGSTENFRRLYLTNCALDEKSYEKLRKIFSNCNNVQLID